MIHEWCNILVILGNLEILEILVILRILTFYGKLGQWEKFHVCHVKL